MFIETCTMPRDASGRPSARTPGIPPSDSRTARAIACATSTRSVARLTLKASSGARTPSMTAPPLGCGFAGGVGKQRAAGHAPGEGREAATPELVRPPTSTRVGVQEDRKAERGEPVREADEPLGMLVQRVVERHDGHDVEGADVRVDAVVPPHVDAVERDRRSRDQPVPQTACGPAGGEHRAVVVGVDMDVQHPRAATLSASPSASSVRRSRPSLKLGTVSSGSTAT